MAVRKTKPKKERKERKRGFVIPRVGWHGCWMERYRYIQFFFLVFLFYFSLIIIFFVVVIVIDCSFSICYYYFILFTELMWIYMVRTERVQVRNLDSRIDVSVTKI